jgi:transcriptional regulator with XRE-family HTH domain
MSLFQGLGRALRWLRDSRGRRQYQVAEAAGVTKAMLSAYETGRQKPSLDTLERLLVALGCDLADLHHALGLVNEGPPAWLPPGAGAAERTAAVERDRLRPRAGGPAAATGLLGITGPLAREEERALAEILQGFLRLVRHHGRAAALDEVAELAAVEEPAPRRR